MMSIEKVVSKQVGDSYYKLRHSSGLDIFIYPKATSTSYAVFGTKYGSVDNCFKRSDESAAEKVPEGIAHFLEHKLFESEDGDAFSRYAKTGASANAYTSFDTTCYLFSCTDNFSESLEILLDFVQSPYFTQETIDKEQGIIGQEIKMYDDDPQWRVMFNHLRALYHSHPIREDITGTVESIAQITPQHLYRCYNTFYNLNNMALVIVGNADKDEILAICDRMLKKAEPVKVSRVFPNEPESIVSGYTEDRLSVAAPLFQFGFKEKVKTGNRTSKDIAAMEVLLDIFSSDSSPLFRKLLDEGLINESSFSHEYFEGEGYATVMWNGESKDPKKVSDMILKEAERLKKEGIPKGAFERTKKALYGNNVSALNSPSNIANAMIALNFKNREIFSYIDAFVSLTIEDIEEKLNSVFLSDMSALSVILPI